jgi:tetratricopeptide (TPR) repeat protein
LNFLRAINSYHVSDTLYAIRRFQLAIKDELNIEECLQYLAKIHLARKEYDQAILKINQAIDKIDQPVELLYLKAKVVEQQGFPDSAYVMLKNAWKYDTLHKELNSELANLTYQQAKFDSSLYYLDKLGKDTSFNIQVLKGDIYFGLRDYPLSTEYYQKALLFQKETDYISRQLDRIDWRINYNKKQRAKRDSIASAKQAQPTNLVETPKDSL